MADLDKLEQLNRLKSTGAITEAEFNQQKSQILSESRGAPSTRIVVMFVLLVLVAAFWFATRPTDSADEALEAQTLEDNITAPINDAPVIPTQAETPLANNLTFATSDAVIGVNPAYLEQKLGVPREKSEGGSVFEVSGCTINYTYNDNGVTGFYLDITRSCQPTIRGRKVSPNTTFGSLLAIENWGVYGASCLTSCGNAADPVIDLSYPGSRSTGFISVSYSTDYDQSSEAMRVWEQTLRRNLGLGEFDIPENYETFSCVRNPPTNVRKLLPQMTVKTVWVTNDDGPSC